MMKIIKQNYLRWLLNAAVLLLLWLGMHYFPYWHYYWLYTLFNIGFGSMAFYICMCPAIHHPEQHTNAWLCFCGLWLTLVYFFSERLDWGIYGVFFSLALVSSVIFFFLDRNGDKKRKDMLPNKLRSVFFMIFATVAYAFPWYFYGVRGQFLAPLFPACLFPFYIASLWVWIYRGWGKKGCLLVLSFLPLLAAGFAFIILLSYLLEEYF